MDASQVTSLIEAAFPTQPLPQQSLHQAYLADDTMYREIAEAEWEAARAKDDGRTWRQYEDAELMSLGVALSHLREPAFAYYLPAFLLFALRHHKADVLEEPSTLMGSAVFAITNRSPYNVSRLNYLNATQGEAIVAFLEFIEANADDFQAEQASEALKNYWKNPQRQSSVVYVA